VVQYLLRRDKERGNGHVDAAAARDTPEGTTGFGSSSGAGAPTGIVPTGSAPSGIALGGAGGVRLGLVST